ncbi:hypothetical protein [Brevibacillus agri]|uniref:Ribbon-helix-helix protein, CopG family n=1 Tax=Brevibacillus brevis TaxID=1393 RepID=A0ABY9TCQ0_BREBE|nr:hypothetical protein [Brevibacillus agri]WNC17872.1 hypothetical protein RGB73_30350 [Brevibacillus brevis]
MKDPKEKRDKKTYCYLTEAEEEKLKQALTIVNEDKSDFIRKAIAERIQRVKAQVAQEES